MSQESDGEFIWRPNRRQIEDAELTRYLARYGLADYEELNEKSAADPAWFWQTVIDHFDLGFYTPYESILDVSKGAPWARWCTGGTTNAVLNILDRHMDTEVRDREAIVWEGEDGSVRRWTYADFNRAVCGLAAGLRALGLGRGDVVSLYMPMVPETIAAFLAVAKIGAIVQPLFSGFGAQAAAVRMNDAGAVALVTTDATRRRGKVVRMKDVMDETATDVPTLRHMVVLNGMDQTVAMDEGRDVWWHDIAPDDPGDVPTEQMDAEDPFMLYFTSGTTGKAKGTVHTHCGFTTKLAADFGLVLDFKPGDRWLWISDIGWVVGALTAVAVPMLGGTIVMAEGTPDYPEPGRMWRLVQDHKVSYLGVAPTTVRALMRYGVEEVQKYDMSSVRITISSGELWNPDSWSWFMQHVCKNTAPILNLSGGTEIGCGIISSTVIHPARPCSFTGSMPGMGADIVDAEGRPVAPGETGELVMRVPSIGLTRSLWNDDDRYLEAYWNRMPGLWVHGDWASRDADGMWYLHGRSDETIMVAGKRCGPSEVEALVMNSGVVAEVAAAGVHHDLKGETVLCACVPSDGAVAEHGEDVVCEMVRDAVVAGLGPAFRPGDVVLVSQLPKTRNMKILRRVVKAVYMGKAPGDLASLVNPEAVDELRDVVSP